MRKLVLATIFILLTSGCASKAPTASKPGIGPEQGAVLLKLIGAPNLNHYDGASHQLPVYIYQLTEPDELRRLSEDSNGLSSLLEGRPALDSVVSFTRTYLQPGKTIILSLNRAPGATHVAVVAGYHLQDKERMIRFLQIPVREDLEGVLKKTTVTKPEKMDVELHLDAQGIGEQTVRASKHPDYAPRKKSIFSIFR